MDTSIFTNAAQLGGTVFTVCIFLWYLTRRDGALSKIVDQFIFSQREGTKASVELSRTLQGLTDTIERNSNVNVKNTNVITENVAAVTENVAATKENTEATKSNGH